MPAPLLPLLWAVIRPAAVALYRKYGAHVAVGALVWLFGDDVLAMLLGDAVEELGDDIGGAIKEAAQDHQSGRRVQVPEAAIHDAGHIAQEAGRRRDVAAAGVTHNVHMFPQLERSPHWKRETQEDPIEIVDDALALYGQEGCCSR